MSKDGTEINEWSLKDVCAMTKIPEGRIFTWRSQGLKVGARVGRFLVFTEQDVANIKTVAMLLANGMTFEHVLAMYQAVDRTQVADELLPAIRALAVKAADAGMTKSEALIGAMSLEFLRTLQAHAPARQGGACHVPDAP